MSAPFLWILLPLFVSGLLILLQNEKVIALIACLLTLFLALAAWLLPIDSALTIGSLTLKLSSSLNILGRQLIITSSDRAFIALIYGSACIWFIPAVFLQIAKRMLPLSLTITALLVSALAVEPFLYAALLIETAVLLSIPLLTNPAQKPGRGLLRFLIFQTMAVPFILFSGWLLTSIESNPGNTNLAQQAGIFLGLGFAFLLAIFPFHSWIPLLAEESHPYILGFVLWIIPTISLFFAAGLIDRYAWLRESPTLLVVLTTAGTLMVATGGIFAAFQRNLARMMGYAIIYEIGFSLLSLSLAVKLSLTAFLLLFIPRMLCLAVWSLSLGILRQKNQGVSLSDVKGFGRKWPYVTIGLILPTLALAGMPLLVGFPVHQAVWEAITRQSLPLALWILIGMVSLAVSSIRVLDSIVKSLEGTAWQANETRSQRFLLMSGWAVLFILGLFPQWAYTLWSRLPALFLHLGQ